LVDNPITQSLVAIVLLVVIAAGVITIQLMHVTWPES
jgi:hypothetical protein